MPVLTRQDMVVHRLSPTMVEGDGLVLCDLDGCLVSQGRAYDDAADFVRACGARFWIVSNNSTHTAEGLSDDLRQLGLDVPASRILLAGEETLRYLSDHHRAVRLALFGSPALEQRARRMGFEIVTHDPEIALLCRDTQFSLTRLDALTAMVENGAEFWVSNMDTAHPGLNGQRIAETGALLAAVEAILGDVSPRSVGKPDPHMVLAALNRSGLTASDAVFLGDTPRTDGAVARAAGLRFIRLDRRPQAKAGQP